MAPGPMALALWLWPYVPIFLFQEILEIDKISHISIFFVILSCNYYLLTGCKGRTRKYKPKVFHTARACEGCLENQGLVFLGIARAPS